MKSFREYLNEACWTGYKAVGKKRKGKRQVPNCVPVNETAAWTRKEGKNPEGGLNEKGVASYRAENPGSKLIAWDFRKDFKWYFVFVPKTS